MTRQEIYTRLMTPGCLPEDESMVSDHEEIAEAVMAGKSRAEIMVMSELGRWPDTYSWMSRELTDD